MPKFEVEFSASIRIIAKDDDDAQDKAMDKLIRLYPDSDISVGEVYLDE